MNSLCFQFPPYCMKQKNVEFAITLSVIAINFLCYKYI